MIRLRWSKDNLDAADAVALTHPRLVRLRGVGSWSFAGLGGLVVATLMLPGWKAAGWEPWQPGTDGCEFSLATNPPGLDAIAPTRIPPDAELVELACGERVWVLPARLAARRLGFDGSAATRVSGSGLVTVTGPAISEQNPIDDEADALWASLSGPQIVASWTRDGIAGGGPEPGDRLTSFVLPVPGSTATTVACDCICTARRVSRSRGRMQTTWEAGPRPFATGALTR